MHREYLKGRWLPCTVSVSRLVSGGSQEWMKTMLRRVMHFCSQLVHAEENPPLVLWVSLITDSLESRRRLGNWVLLVLTPVWRRMKPSKVSRGEYSSCGWGDALQSRAERWRERRGEEPCTVRWTTQGALPLMLCNPQPQLRCSSHLTQSSRLRSVACNGLHYIK